MRGFSDKYKTIFRISLNNTKYKRIIKLNQLPKIPHNCCYAFGFLKHKVMSNKILENWKAIEEIEIKVQEKTNDPKAGFNASSFWLGGDGRHLMIPAMYRTKKGENFSKSYKEMMVYAKFCPFTGKPLYDDSNEADA